MRASLRSVVDPDMIRDGRPRISPPGPEGFLVRSPRSSIRRDSAWRPQIDPAALGDRLLDRADHLDYRCAILDGRHGRAVFIDRIDQIVQGTPPPAWAPLIRPEIWTAE